MESLSFQQLEAFFTVVEYQQLSKAAQAIFVSQPSLSRTVQRLENNIGVKLFHRTSKGMVLTEEGEYLYREMLPAYQKMVLSIHNIQTTGCNYLHTFRIGYHASFNSLKVFSGVRSAISQFGQKYNECSVIEHLHEFRELRQALLTGEIDVAISVSVALENLPNIRRSNLCEIPLCLVMADTSRFAGRELSKELLEELSQVEFFFPSRMDTQTNTNDELSQCSFLGFLPKSVQYLPNLSSVLNAVAREKGMTLGGEMSGDGYGQGLSFVHLPMTEQADQPYLQVAWRENDGAQFTGAFLELLYQQYPEPAREQG